MADLTLAPNDFDFSATHAALQRYVDGDLLSGVSCAVLVGRELVDVHCAGFADKEQGIALRPDHLFRVFSNTKLITSCAALLLMEQGRFELDQPIEEFIPQLAKRRVLKPAAVSIADTEAAHSPITVRQLLSHSSGLSYGLLDPGTLIYKAYSERGVLDPGHTLAQMMDVLADLPLVFHPGTGWEYSVANDVVARLVEVLSGERFDHFLQQRILGPLGMADTGFVVPQAQRQRLVAYYVGANLLDPTVPGLTRREGLPFAHDHLQPLPLLSGGGGLVSSLPDMVALMRALLPGGDTLLKADTLAQMMRNQLPPGVHIRFPGLGEIDGKGYGLAGAVTLRPSSIDPPASSDEFQWGGIAGTHWWISPRTQLTGLLMAQRQMAFWNPFSFDFKQHVYRATGHGR